MVIASHVNKFELTFILVAARKLEVSTRTYVALISKFINRSSSSSSSLVYVCTAL